MQIVDLSITLPRNFQSDRVNKENTNFDPSKTQAPRIQSQKGSTAVALIVVFDSLRPISSMKNQQVDLNRPQ